MLAWFSANLINIVLTAAVVLIAGLLIFLMIRDKRAGKSPCGGNCGGCASCGGCRACGGCHSARPAADEKNADRTPCSAP